MTQTKEISIEINKDTPFIIPTTEIVGAIIAHTAADDLKRAAATPNIITEELGLAIQDDLQISLVENSDGVLHVVLPYYESIDTSQVQLLDEGQVDLVAGGEIVFIAAGAIIGAKIAAIIGVKTVATTTVLGLAATATVLPATVSVAASTGTVAAGAVIGGAIGAGVAGATAGIGVAAAAGAGAIGGSK